jgi:2-oxoglutarate ferredoxin oxidoreductase subunit gamma
MPTSEIRIAGFGGQGVILAGMVIGKAATLFDNKFVTLTQSFGPEARGSACSVQLIVSPEPILYPYISTPDVLVVMSQEACTRFCSEVRPGGLLLYEQDMIKPGKKCSPDVKSFGIPATHLAEELGRKLVLNMVMVGFVTAMTSLTTADAVRKAVTGSVPKGTEQLNLAAFEKGYEYGRAQLTSPASAA